MVKGSRRKLSDKYAPFLLAVLILFSISGYAQTYNPSAHVVINDALGPAQATPTDSRSMFYDISNFIYRDYQSTTEVKTYLNLSKYRTGGVPIYVHLGGSLSGGVWTGGIRQVWWFKNGTNDSNLVRWATDSSSSCSGCLLSANNLSDLANSATSRTNLGLGNVDNTSDATKNAAVATLTNKTISGANNTITNIPNSALNNSTIGVTLGTSGSDFGVTGTPASLGGSFTFNFPVAGPGVTGKLSGSDWSTFNNKLSNITGLLTGGSGYTLNGLGTSGSPYSLTITGSGGSCIGCNADSLKNLPVDTTLRRNGYALTFDSTNHKWVLAPNGSGTGISGLTGDGTASGSGTVTFTLSTVNGSPGSFGSASNVPAFTVNGKGLVTTVTNTPIQISESQVTNLTTDLASKISLTSLSATSPLAYNNSTGVFSIQVANTSQNGYLSSTDWNTFNAKQAALSGTGYLKFSGTTPSYLTPTQVTADLNLFTSSLKGLVPLSGGGTANFLRADGTWAAPPGGGGTPDTIHLFSYGTGRKILSTDIAGDTLFNRTFENSTTISWGLNSDSSIFATSLLTPTGSLTNSGANWSLVNDNASPGNNFLYGTSTIGTKGWLNFFSLPLASSSQNGLLSSSDYNLLHFTQYVVNLGTPGDDSVFTSSLAGDSLYGIRKKFVAGSGIAISKTGSTFGEDVYTFSTTGGAGNTNSNVGSGFRLAFPNTNNIRTLFCSGCTIDSTTNTNGLTFTVTAGGAGTVTSFSAGALSPLFTTSVATATSTPALSFTLSNAAANSVFGNNTVSSAAPAYFVPTSTTLNGWFGSTIASTTQVNAVYPAESQVGDIFNASTFQNSLTSFGTPNASGSATITLSSGYPLISASTINFLSTITQIPDRPSMLPTWSDTLEYQIVSSGGAATEGLGPAFISNEGTSPISVKCYVNKGTSSNGAITAASQTGGVTYATGSGCTNTVNDVIRTVLTKVNDSAWTFQAFNLTSGVQSTVASWTFVTTLGGNLPPNIGNWGYVVFGAGTYRILRRHIVSTAKRYPYVLIAMDSKGVSIGATKFGLGISNTLNRSLTTTLSYSGAGSTAGEFVKLKSEALMLNSPYIVYGYGSNDIRLGTSLAQTEANIIVAAGWWRGTSTKFLITVFPEDSTAGGVGLTNLKNWMANSANQAAYGFTYIDCWTTLTGGSGNICVAPYINTDHIHLTDAGYAAVVPLISAAIGTNPTRSLSPRTYSPTLTTIGDSLTTTYSVTNRIGFINVTDSNLNKVPSVFQQQGNLAGVSPFGALIPGFGAQFTVNGTIASSGPLSGYVVFDRSLGYSSTPIGSFYGDKNLIRFFNTTIGRDLALIDSSGRWKFGNFTTGTILRPLAWVDVPASDGTAGHGSFIIPPGVKLTTPVAGMFNNDSASNHLYWTDKNGVDRQLDQQGGSGVTTVGTFSGSSIANGASIATTTITFGPADGTNPGMVTTGTQTFAGTKTFSSAPVLTTTSTVGQVWTASGTGGQGGWGTAPIVTASNGLTVTSGNVALGGTLSAATTITQSNNALTIAGGQLVIGATATRTWNPNAAIPGSIVSIQLGTLNDATTGASTTVANAIPFAPTSPTLSATNTSVTYTNAYTSFVGNPPAAGTNVTITHAYAFGVNGDAIFRSNLYVSHVLQNSTPTIASGAGAGTSPTISISGGDQSGIITVTTGTTPTASATVATITYGSAYIYPTASFPLLYPGNSVTAILSGLTMVYVTGNTTNFTITAGTSALAPATTYIWYYKVGGM